MGKMSKEEQARFSGAIWMLNLCKEKGIEAAAKELKARGIISLPLGVARGDMTKFIDSVKENTVATVTCLASNTLRDEFGFGRERLNRFIERFNSKTDCLLEDYCTWDDIADTMKDETGLEFNIPGECKERWVKENK